MQLSVRDVSKLLNVTEKTIYRWIQGSGLPAYRVEGQYRINKALLLEWATTKKINISSDMFQGSESTDVLPTLAACLQTGGIYYRIEGRDKSAVLRSVVDVMKLPDGVDREFLFQALRARENLQSTGIGDGVAIPHVRNPAILEVDKPMVSLCFLDQPIEFGALDGKPVQILFALISPTVKTHLHLLSRLSFSLQNAGFKEALKKQATREELLRELERIEAGVHVQEAAL
ncbi:MAG TPA: PTS fructose transporter subunit IIA [Verrucomicrobia bacterium]|nr:MAG: PTS fructose transporter subunit IIA [Lentisphaerae bacterium GWF2_57_35]HBA86209.1 PTS fructose transporter subunit IIA [Verrucomicrobiota bacterium]